MLWMLSFEKRAGNSRVWWHVCDLVWDMSKGLPSPDRHKVDCAGLDLDYARFPNLMMGMVIHGEW